MATKKITQNDQDKQSAADIRRHNLGVMMPFIKFSAGALKLIAHTLIFIVKGTTQLLHQKPKDKPGDNIINIK